MRLLVLSHVFPPSLLTNAKRPHYLVKGFLQAGWQVDVVTSRIGIPAGAGEPPTHPALRIIRFPDPADSFCQLFVRKFSLFKAVTLAAHGVLWPDEFVLWALQALRFAHRHEAEYDAVLVFVLPASMFLGRAGRKWIFDLQEAVTPFLRQLPRRSPILRWLLPLMHRVESRALHRAGGVVFTAETNRQAYLREDLVAPDITAHIPYFFDADAFRSTAGPLDERFQITYLGAFDWHGARTPETFFRSLALFLESNPTARAKTQFLFHGPWLPDHDRFIQELNLQDVVSIRAAIPYEAYLQQLRQSPILLLVVAPQHNLFMPSKIVDYFGSRRPILAFVPRESEMRQVLETAGMAGFTSDVRDIASGAEALGRLWELYLGGKLMCEAQNTSFWSSETQVPRFLDRVTRIAEAVRKR